MTRYSVSALRANLYRLLDRVLETGEPLEIERNGARLRIAPLDRAGRLDRLQAHPGFLVGDPEEIVHLDWSDEWRT
jgi:antitoxin (DNA-binding transcriptional repressor) of toxin-antitoxin stability system